MKVLTQVGFKIITPADDEDDGDVDRQVIKFRSRRFEVLNTDDISYTLIKTADDIQTRIDNSYLSSSNIAIDKIAKITIHSDNYNPTRAGSYIELPKWVSSKKACINIQNEGKNCFKYCVQCSVFKIYEKDNPEIMRHGNQLNGTIISWGCMKFPCSRTCIDRFEEDHQGLISINVYKPLNQHVITDRMTKVQNAEHEIHLLMVEKSNNHHYVLIKDLNKLVGCQYNKNIKHKQTCPHCLRGFQPTGALTKHFGRGCLAIGGQKIQMPKKGVTIHFKNKFRNKAPYVIYADFEFLTTVYRPSMSKPIDPNKSYTEKYQQHKPCGYQINVVNSITNESESYLDRGSDCMEHSVKTCRKIKDQIMNKLKVNVPIIMTEEDEDNFKNATQGYLCEQEIEDNNGLGRGFKVRYHCHMTGKYRGCAHAFCNFQFNNKDFKIPVFFHNLKGYDSHFITCNAHGFEGKKNIDVMAQSSDKFIRFGFDNLQFKDSFSFLSSSLDRLVGLGKYKDYDDVSSGKIAWKGREYLDNWR